MIYRQVPDLCHGINTLQKVRHGKPWDMINADQFSIVGSSHFKFLVGPDRKEFTIHSALVADQSEALNVLVNGGMKEAIEHCAIWQELDEETFLRFCQFAYTGSYDGAEPQKRKAEEHAPVPDTVGKSDNKITNLSIKQRGNKHISPPPPLFGVTKKDLLWNKFCSLHPGPQVKVTTSGNAPDDDYTEVFLSHAQMYVFADCYGIVALENLALYKLRQALMRYTLYREGFHDIFQLVKYCFSSTVDKGGQRDPLRTLVCIYVACKVEDLWKNDDFGELMDTLSEFPRALFREVLYRLG